MSLPNEVNILGVRFSITYTDSPVEVDLYKREALWGQIDNWTRTIRVYGHNRAPEDIWETILHEVLHGIASQLRLRSLEAEANHNDLALLSLALMDVLIRNDWLKRGEKDD